MINGVRMMKAAVLTSYGQPLEIKQVPIPQIGANDVLVKLIACGVCHSDLHVAKAELITRSLPRIMGHEGIGEVVELGTNVGEHIQRGDMVGVPVIRKTCLHCEYCLAGRETLCADVLNAGSANNGCFAEYTSIDADFAIKLPSGMDPFTSAPIYCAGLTVYKALKVSGARPGEWVSITGIGGLGSLGIAYAKAMGLRVVAAVAPNDQTAVKLAKDMGAEDVYDGPSDQYGQWVQSKVGGVHVAIVTVPLIKAYDEAFKSVRRGGRIIAIALPQENISVPTKSLIFSEIQLIGSLVGTRKDLQEALELAKIHKITSKVKKCKLEDINEVFERMENYQISGRVVIDFTTK